MNEEKLRILQMIKDGTISPEEGLDLIESLGTVEKSVVTRTADADVEVQQQLQEPGEEEEPGRRKPKYLRIMVTDGETKKNVNVKIPVTLAKFAGKFIPKDAKEEMKEQGIDLDLEGLMKILEEEGQQDLVQVNDGEGKKVVRIFTE